MTSSAAITDDFADRHLLIVGGGIVGLATAWQALQRFPRLKITLLEKEPKLATHQTGHNSGVIHSGIYYKPGSMKARTCRAGKQLLEEYCQNHGIPFVTCGKVIVATSQQELPQLQELLRRGEQNGVKCEWQTQAQILKREPYVKCVAGLWVEQTGIINYQNVASSLATQIIAAGGTIMTSQEVISLKELNDGVRVKTPDADYIADYVICCGGLQSDLLVRHSGLKPAHRIVPFRGEYYRLKPQGSHLCRGLIYPVPDPRFPFLGVHLTRTIDGEILCGPNAVLAGSREGYQWSDVSVTQMGSLLGDRGFRTLASRYWKMGLLEMQRSISRSAFINAIQKLVPEVTSRLIEPAPAGIRAQAIGTDGELIDDFELQQTKRILHVCNAPSPAATASLQIGKEIIAALASRL